MHQHTRAYYVVAVGLLLCSFATPNHVGAQVLSSDEVVHDEGETRVTCGYRFVAEGEKVRFEATIVTRKKGVVGIGKGTCTVVVTNRSGDVVFERTVSKNAHARVSGRNSRSESITANIQRSWFEENAVSDYIVLNVRDKSLESEIGVAVDKTVRAALRGKLKLGEVGRIGESLIKRVR